MGCENEESDDFKSKQLIGNYLLQKFGILREEKVGEQGVPGDQF